MALLQCPECNNKVSSFAEICPNCGYPIHDHVVNMERDKEIQKLTSQILNYEFKCPEPRVKVCIKCGEPFGLPIGNKYPQGYISFCKCAMPGVEVDYPAAQSTFSLGASLYIFLKCVVPRRIGDQNSDEYKKRVDFFKEQIAYYKEMQKKSPDLFDTTPIPPDPQYFGVIPSYEDVPFIPTPTRNVPRCPICGSTRLKKISTVKKAAKISMFGLFGAGDVGKTWQCQQCGSKF